MNNKIALIGGLVVTGLIVALLALAFHFYGTSIKADEKVTKLQSDNDFQRLTIATQSLNFQRSNEIAGAAQQYAVKISSESQEKEIEYRTILKTEPTCSMPVPADIAHGLLEYTYRLRASAMSEASPNADSRGTGAIAAGALTYCQAVLWINPLLTAIDQANDKLASIRNIQK